MRTALRSLLSLTAALVLVTGAASAAAAASPAPTVGGTLSAEGKTIHVLSNGNVPAHVYMTASDVKLSETDFTILPGQTHDLTFSGSKAVGTVTALYVTEPTDGTESGSASLTLSLIPGRTPPPPLNPTLPALLLLTLAGVLILLRRTKPWTLRLTRATPG